MKNVLEKLISFVIMKYVGNILPVINCAPQYFIFQQQKQPQLQTPESFTISSKLAIQFFYAFQMNLEFWIGAKQL